MGEFEKSNGAVERRRGSLASNELVAAGLSSEDDAAVLGMNKSSSLVDTGVNKGTAKLGYKQELRRNFTLIEIFGIAFSIIGLLPSIASTLAYSIPAGPVGLVWVCSYLLPSTHSRKRLQLTHVTGLVRCWVLHLRRRPRNG